MAKLIALFTRKPDSSRAEFRDYYEHQHAPFTTSLFGHLWTSYTRNYLAEDGSGPDVVTEIVFHDDAAMQEMFAITQRDPAIRDAIFADEAAFMDRSVTRMFLSTEASSTELPGPA
ncbi:EthD domain-containing protein [Nocardioides dubius]|uniref:EthD domain-containing protein n=1 Tax=Nocardioides dubius TaxID=317019 RepID=A0ABP4EE05_9ACTN